jgi:protein gp37
MTFNPVWGCLNHCEYCYARKIAKRFWKQILIIECGYYCNQRPSWTWHEQYYSDLLFNFKPAFLYSQFNKDFPKKPQRIFVGSMSEIANWKEEWMERVLEKIRQYPQHIFQFLTQYPDIYYGRYKFPINCWLGATITRPLNTKPMGYSTEKAFNMNKDNLKFISFEPLLERIEPKFKVDWVIIGAETGNRKDKVIPKKEWIEAIVNYCKEINIPVYLKDSLKDIYPVEIKEFPKTEL